MKKYLELIRVKHWIKNGLIFIPMITAKMINAENIIICLLGFLSFSFAASFIYIVNDIRDIENDKMHERKKNRPLPSGRVTKRTAIILSIILLLISIVSICFIKKSVLTPGLYLILLYVIINIAYSFGLKNVAILDLVLLASGFVIRVYYGAALIDVVVSKWLFLTIVSVSLFCGIGKRKKELNNSKESRTVLKKYNEAYLNKYESIALTLTLIFYSLWTIDQSNDYLIYTVPLLIVIFMRYSLIVEMNDEGDPITVLFSDKLLLVLCGLYGIIFTTLLVVFK